MPHDILEQNATVAVYDTLAGAEAAIGNVRRSGFDMDKLSIVSKDLHSEQHVFACYTAGGKMKCWGDQGGFWTAIWDQLPGWMSLCIPGIGGILVAGPLAAWIVVGLENSGIFVGLSAVGAGLYSIGIPRDRIRAYEDALRADKLLLVAYGRGEEVSLAKAVLNLTPPAPGRGRERPNA